MNYIENIYICLAAPLLIVVLCLRGQGKRSILFVLGGMTACLLSSYISTFLAVVHGTDAMTASIEISPMVEEFMKLFPIVFYILVFEPDRRECPGLLLMIASGFNSRTSFVTSATFVISRKESTLVKPGSETSVLNRRTSSFSPNSLLTAIPSWPLQPVTIIVFILSLL